MTWPHIGSISQWKGGYHTLILFKKPVGWETAADVYAASVLCDENGGALLF